MRQALSALALFGALSLLASAAQAQGGIRGIVIDEEGNPVADASVVVQFLQKPDQYPSRTNDKGEYLQIGLELGAYRVSATKDGYVGASVDVRVNGLVGAPRIQLAIAPPSAAEMTEMFNEASQLANAGELDEAEALYEELLELELEIPEVHGNLGFVHSQRKDWAKAEASYLHALELRPGDSALTLALSQVYRDSGQEEKAQALLDEMAESTPDDGAAQLQRGVFLLNSGKPEEAQAAFEAALAADPSLAEAHYHLGTILVGQGKVPEAIEHLEAYLATGPENAQAVATAEGLLEALKK